MSTAVGPIDDARGRPADALIQWARRNGWTVSLLGFFVLLLVFTKLIQPNYGVAGIQGLAISVLPLALAAAAQAVVVISGGLDLSIGSMMALTSVVAAVLMKGQPEEFGIAVVVGVLLIGLLLGAINGSLVVITRVPDIIVTLAMGFVWAGCALLVIKTPGGAATKWLKDLVLGSIGVEWIPKAAIALIIVVAVVVLIKIIGGSTPADQSFTLSVFNPPSGVGTKALSIGLVFGFLSFAGFEAAA